MSSDPKAEAGVLIAESFEIGAPETKEKALAFIDKVARLEQELDADCLIVLPEVQENLVTVRVFQGHAPNGAQSSGVKLGDLVRVVSQAGDAVQLNTPQGPSARSSLSLPDA